MGPKYKRWQGINGVPHIAKNVRGKKENRNTDKRKILSFHKKKSKIRE